MVGWMADDWAEMVVVLRVLSRASQMGVKADTKRSFRMALNCVDEVSLVRWLPVGLGR